ncbi:hypothetical protein [Prescottella equi]
MPPTTHEESCIPLYENQNREAILRESLILYLDELGTADSASQNYSNEALRADLRSYQRAASVNAILAGGVGFRQITKTFSDNVVFVVPRGPVQPGSQAEVEPIQSILIAALIQSRGISARRVFRGSITSGPIYADTDHILGPGLVEAVRAEEKVAVHPRTIVLNSVFESIHWDTPGGQMAWDHLLVDNSDDLVFVNYLGFGADAQHRNMTLQAHREMIAASLQSLVDNDRVRQKYEWAGRYHNWFVEDAVARGTLECDAEEKLLLSEADGLSYANAHLSPWFSTLDRLGYERVAEPRRPILDTLA